MHEWTKEDSIERMGRVLLKEQANLYGYWSKTHNQSNNHDSIRTKNNLNRFREKLKRLIPDTYQTETDIELLKVFYHETTDENIKVYLAIKLNGEFDL